MATQLLKLDDEQRQSLTKWMANIDDVDPNNAFIALGKASGHGKYPSNAELAPSPLDEIAESFGYLTDRKRLGKELGRDQETLLPFVQKAIQHKQGLQLLRAVSGTPQQVQHTYGIPLLPSQMPMEGPPAPTPRFAPQELQQFKDQGMDPQLLQEWSQMHEAPVMGSLAEQQPPSTVLEPSQLQQLELIQGGHGVMGEQGQYTPMALAKPRPDLLSPEQFGEEVQLHKALGNIPGPVADALLKAPPLQPIPRASAQAAFAEASRRQLERDKQQGTHTLDDTAVSLTGRSMSDIKDTETVTPEMHRRAQQLVPGAPVKVGDNLKQMIGGMKTLIFPTAVAGTKAAATTAATQATHVVEPGKQSNYIHAQTYADSGRLIYPTSTPDDPFTDAKAATGGWKEITDKQKEAIKTIEIARSTQRTLLDLAHQLITAKGPGGAFVQGMKTKFGAFIRSNPIAGAFLGDREAFAGWMARMVEVGVLTQQDIGRWASVLPDARDTVGSAVAKEAVLNMLFDAAELANRRAIVGDRPGLDDAKKTLHEQILMAEKLYAKGKNKPSAQELFKDQFGK